jgi:hypothetical protein
LESKGPKSKNGSSKPPKLGNLRSKSGY